MKPRKDGNPLKQRFQSFRFAFAGIIAAVKSQPNLTIHLITVILVTIAGFHFHISSGEWIAIILSIALVITAELFNTAIEALVNLVSPDFNEQAGKIKDIAAGAVLVSALAALIVGLIIFLPRLI